RLIAVVTSKPSEPGRFYRTATQADLKAVTQAYDEMRRRLQIPEGSMTLIPNELIPTERPSPNARGLSAVTRMGAKTFGDLSALEWTALVVEREANHCASQGQIERVSATNHPLPNGAVQAFITDPPYYDAIPYADLSDFFYVWLRRSLSQLADSLLNCPTTP